MWGGEEDVGDVDERGYFEGFECTGMALRWNFAQRRGDEGEGNVPDGTAFGASHIWLCTRRGGWCGFGGVSVIGAPLNGIWRDAQPRLCLGYAQGCERADSCGFWRRGGG